jgi:ABC-type sugar transport system ATPase subunit
VVTTNQPVLEVREVRKRFGHVEALGGVSCAVYKGEVVALLGDNGAGKSTLVKVISGVLRPDAGQVLLNGAPVAFRRPTDALHSGITTVYQDLAVVDTLDVARNIYLGMVPRRFGVFVDYPKMYADSQRVLDRLRISLKSVRTRVGDLSGGQRQSVAIARALAHDAHLVLMDEPTAALGVAQQEKVNELIVGVKEHGQSVLVISHNLEHVFAIADRIIVLRHGRCVGVRHNGETTREEIVGLITGAVAGD